MGIVEHALNWYPQDVETQRNILDWEADAEKPHR